MLSKDIDYAELIWNSDHAVPACLLLCPVHRDTEVRWLGSDGEWDLIRSNEPAAVRDETAQYTTKS